MVSLFLLVGGYVGWRGISETDNALIKSGDLGNLSSQLLQREIDHLKWIQTAGEFLGDEHITELGVQKDDHQCGFGKWFYSEDRKKAEGELPEIAGFLKQIEEPHKKLHQSAVELEKILKKGKKSRQQAVHYYRKETTSHLKAVQAILGEMRPKVEQRIMEYRKTAEAQADVYRVIASVGTVIGVLVALALGIFLTLSITRPIAAVIHGLTDASEQVASASSQVSSASQSLAEGASEQAAGIEETSSSIEEMSSMTKQNADNANQANTLMSETSRVVGEANEAMKNLTQSMMDISAASEETAKIIRTIDEIAFQTNLLALNAAVEAARAGEAGAGFAVVADEVRNLAMRAAEAAKNTANLIEGSVKKIKNGSETVSKTNDAFTKVAIGAKKIGELVGEISAASQEQAQGIEQINKAVAEMDRVVQRNAASAEESASASEEMNAQAEQMRGVVSQLVSLVEGRNGNGRKSSEFGVQSSETPKNQRILTGVNQAVKRHFRNENVRKGSMPAKAREVKPEQVIPLEEGDFKEF